MDPCIDLQFRTVEIIPHTLIQKQEEAIRFLSIMKSFLAGRCLLLRFWKKYDTDELIRKPTLWIFSSSMSQGM